MCSATPPYKLYQFHLVVMDEMKRREYHPDPRWYDPLYRGGRCEPYGIAVPVPLTRPIYPEHDDRYLRECLINLKAKGIDMMAAIPDRGCDA